MTTLCPKRCSNTLLSKSEFATYMHPKALRQQIRWPQKSTWTWKPNQNQDSSRMPCPPVFWPGFCLRFLVHPSETMRNVTWRWFVAPVLFHWTLPLNNRKKMPYGLHLSQFPHLLTTFKFMWSIIAYSNFFCASSCLSVQKPETWWHEWLLKASSAPALAVPGTSFGGSSNNGHACFLPCIRWVWGCCWYSVIHYPPVLKNAL